MMLVVAGVALRFAHTLQLTIGGCSLRGAARVSQWLFHCSTSNANQLQFRLALGGCRLVPLTVHDTIEVPVVPR